MRMNSRYVQLTVSDINYHNGMIFLINDQLMLIAFDVVGVGNE